MFLVVLAFGPRGLLARRRHVQELPADELVTGVGA
jgi:hypothetical protein